MKRSIGILLGLALVAGAGFAQARGGGGGHGGGGHSGGGHGGAVHTGAGMGARPGMSGGFTHFTTGPTHFTTGPMHFTTGPHPGRPISGIRPGPVVVGGHFHHHGGVIVGGAVVVGAPIFWYPPPYPYYPYVPPAYGGDGYTTPTYVEQGQIAYYCPDYQDYYPNVTSCPSEWMQVVPDTGAYPPQQ
jgi:hypothetical protein